jgi:hypothetical protein
MNMTRMIFTCVFVLLSLTVQAEAKAWRDIVPLHSTRADVERLLGPSSERDKPTALYQLEHENVAILYSTGPCGKQMKGGWNVARDTVISISIYLEANAHFSVKKLDKTRFKRKARGEIENISSGLVAYADEEEGITYEVYENGSISILRAIHYFPAAADDYLQCPYNPQERTAFPDCEMIAVECPERVINSKQLMTVHADVITLKPNLALTYQWTISAGKIVSGQGSSVITVETTDLASQTVTVTVTVEGLAAKCRKTASCTFQISPPPTSKVR